MWAVKPCKENGGTLELCRAWVSQLVQNNFTPSRSNTPGVREQKRPMMDNVEIVTHAVASRNYSRPHLPYDRDVRIKSASRWDPSSCPQ